MTCSCFVCSSMILIHRNYYLKTQCSIHLEHLIQIFTTLFLIKLMFFLPKEKFSNISQKGIFGEVEISTGLLSISVTDHFWVKFT